MALFWDKILLASINETKRPGILAIVQFIVGVQTKDMMWPHLSIQLALCAVLFIIAGQKARETSLFDKRCAASRAVNLRTHDVAVLRRVLWAAVYGEQHVPARRDRRHRRDMRSRGFDQAERARFRAAAHRHAPSRLDRKERASVIPHTPRRARCCTVECALRLVRYARNGSLARHDGGSCRGLERGDGGVACAAEASTEMVLCEGEG